MTLKLIILAVICACVIGQVTSYHHAQRNYRNARVSPLRSMTPSPGAQLNVMMRPFNNNLMMLKHVNARTGQWLKMLIPRIRVRQQTRPPSIGIRRLPGNSLITNSLRMSNLQRSPTQALRQYRRRIHGANRNIISTNNNRLGQIRNGLRFSRFRNTQNNRQPGFLNTNRQRFITQRRTASGVGLSLRQRAFRAHQFNFRTPGNAFFFNNPAMHGNWAGNFGRGRNDDSNFDFDFDDFDRSLDSNEGFDDRLDSALGLNNFDDRIDDDSGDGPFNFEQEDSDWFKRNVNAIPFGNQEQFNDRAGMLQTDIVPLSTKNPNSNSKVAMNKGVPLHSGNDGGVNTINKVADKDTNEGRNTIVAIDGDTNALNVDGTSFNTNINEDPANKLQIAKISGLSSPDSVKIGIFNGIQGSTNQGSTPIQGLELLGQRRTKKLKDLNHSGTPTPSQVQENVVSFSPGVSTAESNLRPSGLGLGAFSLLGIDANTVLSNAGDANSVHSNNGGNNIHTPGSKRTIPINPSSVNLLQQRQVASANFGFSGGLVPSLNRNLIDSQNQAALGGLGFNMGSSFAQNNIFGNQNAFGRPMVGPMNALDKLDFGFR